MASEHEQPKAKKLKAVKPQVENEIPEVTELVKGNENPEKKKKKKKKKNLSEMVVATVSNPPVISEKAVSPSKDFKMEIDSTGKKSEATGTENSPKKKKKKKQAKKLLAQEDQKAGSSSVNEGKKKKKKKKNATETTANKKSATIRGFDITDDRLKAYGIRNPKKFKNAIIFGNLKKSKD